jgi:hypothetical protein
MTPSQSTDTKRLLTAVLQVRRAHHRTLWESHNDILRARRSFQDRGRSVRGSLTYVARLRARSELHRADQALAAVERALRNLLQSGSCFWARAACERLNVLFLAVENEVHFLPDQVRASVAAFPLSSELRDLLGRDLRKLPRPRLRKSAAQPQGVLEVAASVDRATMAALHGRILAAMPELLLHEKLLLKSCLLDRHPL